jgi:hypothetical protein
MCAHDRQTQTEKEVSFINICNELQANMFPPAALLTRHEAPTWKDKIHWLLVEASF